MSKLLIVFVCVSIAGCATSQNITYKITSIPEEAPIDVNGMSMGKTPTSATLECTKKWVGLSQAPGGWANVSGAYEVKAYPPAGTQGYSQTKNIDPCQWQGSGSPSIQFDLGLESVEPTQKININANITNPQTDIDKSLNALKTLHDDGLLSDEEYKSKVLDLTK